MAKEIAMANYLAQNVRRRSIARPHNILVPDLVHYER